MSKLPEQVPNHYEGKISTNGVQSGYSCQLIISHSRPIVLIAAITLYRKKRGT